MPSALASFEASLDELDVPVTRTDPDSFRDDLEAAVDPPTVGVAVDETLDDPRLSLDDAPVDVDPTPVALREATTGVTAASLGVGEYGSLLLEQTDDGAELVSLFVDRHVAILRESDVVPDLSAAIADRSDAASRGPGGAILATGPSATADMGALVRGAHGPSEVHVLVVEAGDGPAASRDGGES